MHFFVISTAKTALNPSVFNTFYFQMCFVPQRRALFQHLNFQKWSDAEVFCTFSLRNRLRATTACNFSSLISPDVSAPAALASLLFNPPEPQNHEKTQCFATFLPFRAPASFFFWSFLFWLFSLLTAFSSLHIVGSLTSKLPSINTLVSHDPQNLHDEIIIPYWKSFFWLSHGHVYRNRYTLMLHHDAPYTAMIAKNETNNSSE